MRVALAAIAFLTTAAPPTPAKHTIRPPALVEDGTWASPIKMNFAPDAIFETPEKHSSSEIKVPNSVPIPLNSYQNPSKKDPNACHSRAKEGEATWCRRGLRTFCGARIAGAKCRGVGFFQGWKKPNVPTGTM